MPRYNSISTTNITTSSTTLISPAVGLFTTLSGASGYSVTLPNPVLYNGQSQKFYNITGGDVTLVTPSGVIRGPTATNVANYIIGNGSILELTSNGTDYVVTLSVGGAIAGTSATFSGTLTANGVVSLSPSGSSVTVSPSNANVVISPTGTGTVTISPATAGSINNISIGASTRSTGAFTSLTSNAATTFTQNTASSSTTTGTLVVTGGVGISGNIYAGGIQSTPITGSTGSFTTLAANGAVTFTSSTASTTTGTGALVVTGGVGIGGQLTVNSIVETSSIALKRSITPLDHALDKVVQLVGVNYIRKDTKKEEVGLIAEEVVKILPELVATDEKGKPQGIQYTKLTAYLIECIKELKAEIDILKSK